MENTYTPTVSQLCAANVTYSYVDLPRMLGDSLPRLPVVLRLLLENVTRNTDGEERAAAMAIEAADAKAATEAASDHVRLLGDNLSGFIAAIQDGFLHQRGEG